MYPVVETKRAEVAELCARHNVRRLELFGSAVRGGFDPAASDLDFLVQFKPMPPGEYPDHFFGLQEALEALFHHHVDLIELGPIRNPYFLAAIQPTRVELYAG